MFIATLFFSKISGQDIFIIGISKKTESGDREFNVFIPNKPAKLVATIKENSGEMLYPDLNHKKYLEQAYILAFKKQGKSPFDITLVWKVNTESNQFVEQNLNDYIKNGGQMGMKKELQAQVDQRLKIKKLEKLEKKKKLEKSEKELKEFFDSIPDDPYLLTRSSKQNDSMDTKSDDKKDQKE